MRSAIASPVSGNSSSDSVLVAACEAFEPSEREEIRAHQIFCRPSKSQESA